MKSVYTTLLFCVLASLASGATIPQSHKRMNDGKYSPGKVIWYDEYHHGGGAGTPPGGGGGGGGDDCDKGGKEGGGGGGGGGGGDGGGVKDPGTTDPGTTDPGTTDPGTTDPGTTDPGTMDPEIPDPDGPDPNSEPINPAILDLIDITENEGPWPEIIDFTDDAPDEDVSVSDVVPWDYCVPESDGSDDVVAQVRGPDSDQIYQDYCLDNFADPDVRGQFPGSGSGSDPIVQNNTTPTPPASNGSDTVTRRSLSHFHKRTYADTEATGSMNRWKRGSVISVCVERNNGFMIRYGKANKLQRASAVVAGATERAIDRWNTGLDPRYIQFEFVETCRDAVFKVVVVNRASPSGKALATAPLPPRGSPGDRFREIYVWSASFTDDYQNVLTAIQSHELGHTIGLAHENCGSINQDCNAITEETADSIMRATISNSSKIEYRGPTAADHAGTNLFYEIAGGAGSEPPITLWTPSRGALINYPPIPKCTWILGFCYY